MAKIPTGASVRASRPPRGEDRQRDIVQRAASLFDQVGYHRASMEDLAAEVGLAKPTLYHHFKGKEEILYRIHQEFITRLIDQQEERARTDMDPVSQLREVMGDILELMETHRGHVRVFFEHRRELPPDWHEIVTEQRTRYQTMVEGIVRSAISQGQFRQVDVPLTTLAIFGMCNWAYQWYQPQGRLRPREVTDLFLDLLLEGLQNE